MQATRCNDHKMAIDYCDSTTMLKQDGHVTNTTITDDGFGHKQIGFEMNTLAAETPSTLEKNIIIVFNM